MTIPFHSYTPMPARSQRRLRALHCGIHKSPWGGSHGRVKPILLPFRWGNGRDRVAVTFYNAPELVFVIPFDSRLPLDLDLPDRCVDAAEVRCFRDALDEIYDELDEREDLSPAIIKDLLAEYPDRLSDHDGDELQAAWSILIQGGSTWCRW